MSYASFLTFSCQMDLSGLVLSFSRLPCGQHTNSIYVTSRDEPLSLCGAIPASQRIIPYSDARNLTGCFGTEVCLGFPPKPRVIECWNQVCCSGFCDSRSLL
jgi:hypothetical protein